MRKLSKGHIELLDSMYTLKVTDNKRRLIYDKNNKLVSTEAYKIYENKIMNILILDVELSFCFYLIGLQ